MGGFHCHITATLLAPLKPPFLTTHNGLCGCSPKHTLTCEFSPPQMPWEAPRALTTQTTCASNLGDGASPPSQRPSVSQHFFYKAAPPYHVLARDPTSQPLSFMCALYLKYGAKAPRQICWQTTALSKVGVGWKPTCFSPYGQATQETQFQKGRPKSPCLYEDCLQLGYAHTGELCHHQTKTQGGPSQAKDTHSYLKGKALLMLQKILSPARDPTDSCSHALWHL